MPLTNYKSSLRITSIGTKTKMEAVISVCIFPSHNGYKIIGTNDNARTPRIILKSSLNHLKIKSRYSRSISFGIILKDPKESLTSISKCRLCHRILTLFKYPLNLMQKDTKCIKKIPTSTHIVIIKEKVVKTAPIVSDLKPLNSSFLK